mmetsp:Transcript_11503/g.32287  ORF Transcript_11503/g.32287 Transcript_11503/m.32287 type:complete len:307 (+) Transcript_11503:2382-3302(+)
MLAGDSACNQQIATDVIRHLKTVDVHEIIHVQDPVKVVAIGERLDQGAVRDPIRPHPLLLHPSQHHLCSLGIPLLHACLQKHVKGCRIQHGPVVHHLPSPHENRLDVRVEGVQECIRESHVAVRPPPRSRFPSHLEAARYRLQAVKAAVRCNERKPQGRAIHSTLKRRVERVVPATRVVLSTCTTPFMSIICIMSIIRIMHAVGDAHLLRNLLYTTHTLDTPPRGKLVQGHTQAPKVRCHLSECTQCLLGFVAAHDRLDGQPRPLGLVPVPSPSQQVDAAEHIDALQAALEPTLQCTSVSQNFFFR